MVFVRHEGDVEEICKFLYKFSDLRGTSFMPNKERLGFPKIIEKQI